MLVDPESFGTGIEGAVDRYVAMTRATQQLVILTERLTMRGWALQYDGHGGRSSHVRRCGGAAGAARHRTCTTT